MVAVKKITMFVLTWIFTAQWLGSKTWLVSNKASYKAWYKIQGCFEPVWLRCRRSSFLLSASRSSLTSHWGFRPPLCVFGMRSKWRSSRYSWNQRKKLWSFKNTALSDSQWVKMWPRLSPSKDPSLFAPRKEPGNKRAQKQVGFTEAEGCYSVEGYPNYAERTKKKVQGFQRPYLLQWVKLLKSSMLKSWFKQSAL